MKLKIFIGKFVHTSDRLGPKQQPLKLAGLTNNSSRRPEQKLFNYVGHPQVSMFRKIQVFRYFLEASDVGRIELSAVWTESHFLNYSYF